MTRPVSSLRNLGPAMDEACAKAGIGSADELESLGAHEAYRKLLHAGTSPHFIGYYVLHMALQGRPWNDCKGAEKEALRTAFDTLKAEVAQARKGSVSEFERTLDAIGLLDPAQRR